MIILPAIDLKDGKCVRLYKGEESSTHVVAESAIEMALTFERSGAKYIHMVDLDGAFSGSQKNLDTIEEVVKSVSIPVEVGGGIRNMEVVEKLISIGVSRVILGTAALKDEEFLKEAVKKYGDKIAVGIDFKDGKVAIKGWVEVTEVGYLEFAAKLETLGVKTIIVTDISKDGTLEGPNLDMLKELKEKVNINIIASGGIKDIENIKDLNALGVYGAITGKAIYSGTLDLKEAIAVCS
ncbi:1-(5-phosphoribosyl)-5-[(5-phosphoribosylamino) methylideneamino] imidazole-4-carboxamide isomerase [Clostridium polyendosporum]|uniref:1-(5-phosphoribosyl)-5-[(5-phosphoribosylamino)methylideneamino] imidazole-4-carboxamide isomerase n=1 Tax=Clostridium polyendosporum TaxID=69208 RepID=A0A919VFJ9_9CLOT|nr:1-(5-phosphoribosyl)-5-[(5-phosphoribosylamino)methylideneamino]imidazole-4-carboxamide isomerase [Clostridium polyendosporum]GIM28232.1 1-(5-phosphoribosyl)-5-[(5-phosphoribosylamino) methylideneamino] imidazole-4-carboxamide isomerase [Clostridium polyendosporum]